MKLREGYDPEFVYYNVLFNIDKVKNLGEGTTFAEISKAALSTVKLDFPESLSEQRKIAEILTTVDRAIEETEALVGKQQRIKTGLMQDLLTRGIDAHGQLRTEATHAFKDSPLGRIPVEWEAGTIGQYCNVQGGFAFPSSEYCVDGVGLIRISNIQKDSLTMSNAVSLPDKFGRSLPQFLTKPGDVLIAMSGATTGKTCRVTSENAPALINQRVGRFQIIKDEEIIIDFIYGIVTSDKFLSEVVIDSLGGAQPNVSPGEIESFSFPKPPVEEQRRIMEKLSFHDIQSRKNSDALAKLRALKTALMQDLLTGRKRVPGLLGSGLQ
jgi:type I restriction enzyme S subunit